MFNYQRVPDLVMTNSSPWYRSMALIEIDGSPLKNGWIFHGEMLNNQMVYEHI